jgi:glycosyltransferase involved in cell wall biosynthesis
LINKIKKLIPQAVRRIIGTHISNRGITNVFNKKYAKRVLISHTTAPFRRSSLAHSNYYEVTTAAKIFDEMEYIVDVIHFEGKPPKLDKYDLIYGFGDVFKTYFERGLSRAKTIHYGAGMHVCHQNTASLQRVRDVYRHKKVWLVKSARVVEKTWSHQTMLVDGIIALGNAECKNTYQQHYKGTIRELPAPYYRTQDGLAIMAKRASSACKSFLWFGSAGLVHKGLDLCLDYFATRPDLQLHICGDINAEPEFIQVYKKELFQSPNIHVHGFVNIDSEKFAHVLELCSFVIFPSCSEGGSPSVLSCVGNGGLIPIVSREASFSTGHEIIIKHLDFEGVRLAVNETEKLTCEQVREQQRNNFSYATINHNQDIYYDTLKKAIREIIELSS